MNKLIFFCLILSSIVLVNADFGYNNLGVPQLPPEINYSKIIVNLSTNYSDYSGEADFWDGLDTPADIDHNDLVGLQGGGGEGTEYYHLNLNVYESATSFLDTSNFADNTLTIGSGINLLFDNGNITSDWTTSNYFSGQPLDGAIGSGILNASSLKVHCGCVNASDQGGLDVWYPDTKVKIWNYGINTYCDIAEDTYAVPDNSHTVYYVDSNCAIQTMTRANYFAQDINPPNKVILFDVYTQNGDIELVKGASVIGVTMMKSKFNQVNCGGKHLSVCDGMDITEGTFPEINMSAGHFNYVNSISTSVQRDSNPDELHVICYSDNSHTAETEIDIDKCDNGVSCDACPDNKYRRYIIGDIGWGTIHTQIHQLAPLDGDTFNNLVDCINTPKYPLDYTIPSDMDGVFVPLAFYCGRRDDTAWGNGFVDLRLSGGGFGASADLSNFVPYIDANQNVDLGNYNISVDTYFGDGSQLNTNSSTWWAGLTGWVSGWFGITGNELTFNETKLNKTISNEGIRLGFNSTYNETYASIVGDNSSWNESYADTKYILTTEESNLNVNSSLSLNTSIGYIKDVNATWFDLVGYILTIDLTQLNSYFDTLFSAKTTDDLSQGSTNLYQNMTLINNTIDERSINQTELNTQIINNETFVKNNTSPTFQNLTFMGYDWIYRIGDCETLPCMTSCTNSSGGLYINVSGC